MSSEKLMDIATLRRDFDHAFASPPAVAGEESERLLSIRVAGDPFALRLRDISELVAQYRAVAIPSRTAALLGIAGLKGRLVPVFSLAVLLGYPGSSESGRWLAVCGGTHPLGLAFSEFEKYLLVPRSAISAAHEARQFAKEIVQVGTDSRLVINIGQVLSQVMGKAVSIGPKK